MPLLSAKPIINFCGVNLFTWANQWTINSGDPVTLYFQLIDTSQAVASNNAVGFGLFYGTPFTGVTGVGPTGINTGATAGTRWLLGTKGQQYSVKVTFPSIDSNQVITVNATQASPYDSSIWVVSIPANQAIAGGNVQFAVTDGNSVYRFSVMNVLDVLFPGNVGGC